MILKITNKQFLYDISCISAIYLFSLRTILIGIQFQIIASVLTLPYLFYILHCSRKACNGLILFIFYSILTVICSILNTFFTSNGIGGCLVLIATLTLGIYCIINLCKLRLHVLIIVLINVAYIIYNVLVLEINPNEIYESVGLSRNHGGMILCLFTGFYCFIVYIKDQKVSILLPLISLFCAYIMVGRSSMGLLAGLFFVSLYASDKKTIAVILSISILSLYFIFKEEFEMLYEASSFAEHGMESSRFDIWASYFEHLNLETTFFGPETNDIPIVSDYGGNPHNSFLNFHRRIGLLPLCFYLILSIASIWKYILNNKIYAACIMLILYGRIFFDSDCFIGTYDFVMYTFLFYPFFKYNHPNKCNNLSIFSSFATCINPKAAKFK